MNSCKRSNQHSYSRNINQNGDLFMNYPESDLIVCNICGAFLKERNILDHVTRVHCNSYFYKCGLCHDYEGLKKEGLFQHQRDKHNNSNCIFTCPLCTGCMRTSQDEILSHIKTAHCFGIDNRSKVTKMIGGFICTFKDCSKAYLDSYKLFSHYLNDHCPEVTLYYNCSMCSLMFDQKQSLFQHNKDKHCMYDEFFSGKTLIIACNLCSSELDSKESFRKHMARKHKIFYYNCPFKNCDYTSELYWSFTNHVIDKHLSENICYYACSECDLTHSNVDSLIQHMRDKHYADEDYCLECHTYEDDLSDHIINEHDYDEYQSCLLCNKTFYGKNKLVNHLANKHNIKINWVTCM